MTITNVKAMVAKVMTVGLLAGAFVMASPKQAEAQRIAFGVQVGYPYRYDHIRAEQFRHREDLRRHAEWDRAHYGYGYRHAAPYYYR